MCIAKTAGGATCSRCPNQMFCKTHQRMEDEKTKIAQEQERIKQEQERAIQEEISEAKQEAKEEAKEEFVATYKEIKAKLDQAVIEREYFRSELREYNTIREFEAIKFEICNLIKSKDWIIMNDFLRGKDPKIFKQLCIILQSNNPFDTYHKLRLQRNKFAHSFTKKF